MRANYVDRLLADADGAVATIWITGLFTTDAPPSPDTLRRAFAALVAETPRLNSRWDSPARRWRPQPATERDLRDAVREHPPATLAAATAALIAESIDLARDIPVRITTVPLTDGAPPRTLLAIQLHHSLGDGRASLFLTRRFWEWCAGHPTEGSRLGEPAMSDRRALFAAALRPAGVAALARSEHRVLASRGQSLRHSGATIGAPMLRSLRVPLSPSTTPRERSSLYFAAMLAGIAATRDPARIARPVRLRLPVDLRRELGIGVTLENACSALAVEVDDDALTAALDDPARLRSLVPDAVEAMLRAGVHWATLVECLVVSRVATRPMLRDHLRPDLVAERRANTMVVTYLGTVDRYLTAAPFPIHTLQAHTPTWGATGFSFRDALVINCASFAGLWSAAELDAFVDAARAWITRHHGPGAEVIA